MSDNIIFIHGAGLGGWIWDDVIRRMDQPALPVDLPNRGNGHANKDLKMSDYFQAVVSQIDNWDKDRFVLVCHSLGGALGLRIASHYGQRVAAFVGFGAAIPVNGGSFASALPFPQKFILPLIMRMAGTRPPDAAMRKGLCNDLTEEKTGEVIRRFTPESRKVYIERTDVSIPSCRRYYVKLSNDKEFPADLQDKMASNLKATRVETVAAGHLGMISKPDESAERLKLLIEAAR